MHKKNQGVEPWETIDLQNRIQSETIRGTPFLLAFAWMGNSIFIVIAPARAFQVFSKIGDLHDFKFITMKSNAKIILQVLTLKTELCTF